MPALAVQLVAYGFLASVLLLHAGLSYRLYHRRREPSALALMGFLLARCGSGLALVFNAVLAQVIFPQFGAVQVILLGSLVDLPFHALVPFCFLQFVLAHLERPLTWKLKLGYWVAFGGLVLFYTVRNLWLLLHPERFRVIIHAPITLPIGTILVFLGLGYWAATLIRAPDSERRRSSALLAAALAFAFLLPLSVGRRGLYRLEIRQTRAVPAQAGPASPSSVDWERLLTALIHFWGVIPAYWVLREHSRIPRPANSVVPGEGARTIDALAERFGLSPREGEVAALVMEGRSNKEICDALFISLDTVKRHVTNVYRKTGVRNRVQLSRLLQPGPNTD